MSFLRHEEIYPCGEENSVERAGCLNQYAEGAILANHAPAHRNDESPAGYSSAGCSPAVPASASPAAAIILGLRPHANDLAVNGKLSLVTVSQPRGSLHSMNFPTFQYLGEGGISGTSHIFNLQICTYNKGMALLQTRLQ
jgi:hypothetical protein